MMLVDYASLMLVSYLPDFNCYEHGSIVFLKQGIYCLAHVEPAEMREWFTPFFWSLAYKTQAAS